MKPKRFAVFSYYEFYPSGGWSDFEASYDTLEDAMREENKSQIVDLQTGVIVWGDGV